jgi:DNA-binding MarR family transcriptional regulator
VKDVMHSLPGYALRRAAAAISSKISERFAEAGLRMAEASILMLIAANPGISSAQLGRTLGIQRANMTPLIARMEALGWVKRTARDGRSLGLDLSEAGKSKAQDANRISAHHEAALLDRIPAEHRAHFLPALQAIMSDG